MPFQVRRMIRLRREDAKISWHALPEEERIYLTEWMISSQGPAVARVGADHRRGLVLRGAGRGDPGLCPFVDRTRASTTTKIN